MKTIKILAVLLLTLGTVDLAQAHAFLDHAEPRVGSILQTSPTVVKIWFTEELEPAFSKIRVFNSAGEEVDKRDDKIDLVNRTVMSVSVPKLASGAYKVIWDAVAVDTHHTHGTFTFQVMTP